MLFDNAKLQPGETILVHAGGSGIGTVAILMAKAIGCTVITTVGDDDKIEKAKALGADHVINYRKDRFETITRKLTGKKGVDVVFEHVGGEGFNGSLLVLKRGGRLVTCGSTAGPTVQFNLMQLFQQQYKIFGSFGATMRNIRDGLDKMATGHAPVIDMEVPLDQFERGLERLESRQVFGKSHRHVLMRSHASCLQARCAGSAQFERFATPCSAMLAVGLIKMLRWTDPHKMSDFAGNLMRKVGPKLREHKIGQANLRDGVSGKIGRARSRKFSPASGTISAASRSNSPISTASGITTRTIAGASHIDFDPASEERFIQLRDDGKPALVFAAHLANWEMPALPGPAHDLPSAVVYRAPNIGAIADMVMATRGVNMGQLIKTGLDARAEGRARRCSEGLHVGMLVDQYYVRGVPVTFFGRQTNANPLIARLARQVECPIHGARVVRLPNHRFRVELTEAIAPVRDAQGRIDIRARCRRSPAWSKAGSASTPSNGCGCTAGGGDAASRFTCPVFTRVHSRLIDALRLRIVRGDEIEALHRGLVRIDRRVLEDRRDRSASGSRDCRSA